MSLLFLLLLLPLVSSTNLKIVSDPDKTTCSPLICSGVALHSDTLYTWWDSSFYRGHVGKRVDIRACGFTTPAVVTVTARTRKGDNKTCPGLFSGFMNEGGFNVYSVNEISAQDIRAVKCDVHWIVTGFADCE